MLRIESILIENGFKLTHGLGYYSSIIPGGVRSMYSSEKVDVIVGLNEYPYPPTLISPRPNVKWEIGNRVFMREMEDSEVIGWLEKSSDKEILDFVLSKGKKII